MRIERATIYGPEMNAAILRRSVYAIEKKLHQRMMEASEPFVLVCEGNEADTGDTALLCGTHETASSGLRVKFLFRTNNARMTQTRSGRIFVSWSQAFYRAQLIHPRPIRKSKAEYEAKSVS